MIQENKGEGFIKFRSKNTHLKVCFDEFCLFDNCLRKAAVARLSLLLVPCWFLQPADLKPSCSLAPGKRCSTSSERIRTF